MNKTYINSCIVSPNPANAKQTVTITLEIEERPVVFEKSIYKTKEIKIGEKVGII